MVLKEMTRPLSPALTEEHEMLLAAVREFAGREIAPIAAEYDESGEFPIRHGAQDGRDGIDGH